MRVHRVNLSSDDSIDNVSYYKNARVAYDRMSPIHKYGDPSKEHYFLVAESSPCALVSRCPGAPWDTRHLYFMSSIQSHSCVTRLEKYPPERDREKGVWRERTS